MTTPRSVRPYQLACLFCRAGAEELSPVQASVAGLAGEIAATPDLPLMLRCNLGDLFAYQDPGTAEDTPEGADFNRKRDVDVLQWLDLAPGSVLPARMLLNRLLLRVQTVRGLCGYESVTSEAWRGCAKAFSGDYERGRERGLAALIPPRPQAEMEAEKAQSLAALAEAQVVPIRPHILVCSVCQYGNGLRPPFAEDNLPELLQTVLQPDCALQVEFVPGADWAMCAPCPYRSAEGCCVTGRLGGGGLYNEVKDVNVLQALGLTYGTVLRAREAYRLIFDRIPTPQGVCALSSIPVPEYSVWRDACGEMAFPGAYERAREELRQRMG